MKCLLIILFFICLLAAAAVQGADKNDAPGQSSNDGSGDLGGVDPVPSCVNQMLIGTGSEYTISTAYNYAADIDSTQGVTFYNKATTTNYPFDELNGDNFSVRMLHGLCYNMDTKWDNKVWAINVRNNCVILYDQKDCKGHKGLRMERFDYAYNSLSYNYFGGLTSSFRLCEPNYS